MRNHYMNGDGERAGSAPSTHRPPPPVDGAVLARLRQDVGEQILRSFAGTYLDLLDRRLAHIDLAIARQDGAGALRDVPDLRIGSAMLGAGRLAVLTEALERLQRSDRTATAAALLPGIRSEAGAVAAALRADEDGGGSSPHPPNL